MGIFMSITHKQVHHECFLPICGLLFGRTEGILEKYCYWKLDPGVELNMSLSIGTWSKSTELRKPECCAGKLPNGVDDRWSFSCDNSLFWLIFWYIDTDEVNRTSGYRISCSATSRLSKQTLGTILYHNWLQFGYHSLRSWELFPVSVLGLD